MPSSVVWQAVGLHAGLAACIVLIWLCVRQIRKDGRLLHRYYRRKRRVK